MKKICEEVDGNSQKEKTAETEEDTGSMMNITPESFQEIGKAFISLTKAWSPMLLSIFCSESILLIMAGFVVAKQEAEKTAVERSMTYTAFFLLFSTGAILFYICYMCDGTHRKVLECTSMVK